MILKKTLDVIVDERSGAASLNLTGGLPSLSKAESVRFDNGTLDFYFGDGGRLVGIEDVSGKVFPDGLSTAEPSGPRPIRVDELKQMVLDTGNDYAVVVAVRNDGNGSGTQFVTYGRRPEDKATAATAAKWLEEKLFGPNCESRVNEHFQVEAARVAAKVEEMMAVLDGGGNAGLKLETVRAILAEIKRAPITPAEQAALS